MDAKEAKDLSTKVFNLIENAKSVSDLESIIEENETLKKNKMKGEKYPEIKFEILEEEIRELKGISINDNNELVNDLSTKINDPLTKLLYAMVWKQGDLEKVKHIIKGILDGKNVEANQETALVMYQFGKHLSDKKNQPIVDQHVIRAFLVYHGETDSSKIDEIRRIEKVREGDVCKYKEWLDSKIGTELKEIPNFLYHVDQVLFATGKAVKLKKHRGS